MVPISVNELNQKLDKSFETNTFQTQEATTEFAKHISGKDDLIYIVHDKKVSTLVVANKEVFDFDYPEENTVYKFRFADNEAVEELCATELVDCSYFLFTPDSLFIRLFDQEAHKDILVRTYCRNAYKKLDKNQLTNSYQEIINESTGNRDFAKTAEKTWENWKILIRKLHRGTRLAAAGVSTLIMAAVNLVLTLIMGFMVWVLTRGKQNAYRLFSVWECFKIAFWAALCPGLLTCGFGFLFKGFAKTLFPLLVGVRVMWLSMKSLRPDGSGYAESN